MRTRKHAMGAAQGARWVARRIAELVVEGFEFRNVADDGELQGLVEKARTLLAGVTTDELRTTADVRSRVQQGMAEIATEKNSTIIFPAQFMTTVQEAIKTIGKDLLKK